MRPKLRRGTRALTIPVDRVKSVNGLIRPGDRVDVIAIVPARGPAGPVARTILRDIEVLALGSATDELGATPAPDAAVAATATLEVTPSQADLLALIGGKGLRLCRCRGRRGQKQRRCNQNCRARDRCHRDGPFCIH